MSNKPSLQDQIKQRKHEEIRRGIQAKQVEKTKGPADVPQANRTAQPAAVVSRSSNVRPVQPAMPKQATQSVPTVSTSVRAPFQSLSTRQKTTLIATGASIMMLVVFIGTFLIASNAAASANAAGSTPTFMPVGTSSADALLQRFQDLGVALDDEKPYDLANSKVWTATEAYTFNIKRNNAEASFLVLSYDSSALASKDIFNIMLSAKYKTWKSNVVANVVLLAAPGSKSEIVSDLFSHMLTYLYAPYHPWSSATPPPTATSVGTAPATAAK